MIEIGSIMAFLGFVMAMAFLLDSDFIGVGMVGVVMLIIGGMFIFISEPKKDISSIKISKESLIKTGNATYSTTSRVFILKDGLMEVK